MSSIDDYERVSAASREEWRSWLRDHHADVPGVWLVYYKQSSGRSSLSWSEAVDEALCFGWIDGRAQPVDDDRYEQYFTRRKPSSPWSRINKEKIKALDAAGRLMPAGAAAVEAAKANGSWTLMDSAEALIVPDDLAAAFPSPADREYFDELPPSVRRNALAWIALAKRQATRTRRIEATVRAAANRERPNGY